MFGASICGFKNCWITFFFVSSKAELILFSCVKLSKFIKHRDQILQGGILDFFKITCDLGFGTGLYRTPPYYAVKVPVFSFEKLMDANSYLGPEMKSTGEVLGVGRTLEEALFKGLTAAGRHIKVPTVRGDTGVLISVDPHDDLEVVSLAKKLDDLGYCIYATRSTAQSIENLGIDVTELGDRIGPETQNNVFALLESGVISFIVYTGALMDDTLDDYIALSRKALLLNIPCFTSLDTAMATADIVRSHYNQQNTELTDICHMR